MVRVIAICWLAAAFSASLASAQTSADQDLDDVASRYVPAPTHETWTQQQRRQRADTARQLVFHKAAVRAARRDQRIATAKSLGISHARPAVNQNWLNSYLWLIRRIQWPNWAAPVELPEETAVRPAPRY